MVFFKSDKIIRDCCKTFILLKSAVKIACINITILFIFFNILAAQDSKSDAVKQMLGKSGARQQIAEISQVVQALIPSQLSPFGVGDNPELSEYIITNLSNYFSGDEMLGRIENHFLNNFNKQYINKIMKWYDSELGNKIVNMEVKASTPEGVTEIISFSYQLQLNPPEEKRMELINELILILELDKKSVEKMKAVFLRTIIGINSSLPGERRMEEEVIVFMTKSITGPFTEQMNTLLPATFLYTYQNLSNEELVEYINFLNMGYSKWFNNNLYDSMLASIEDSSERFGKDIGKKIAEIDFVKREMRHWIEYNVKNTDYALDLPGEPEFDTQDIPTELGIMKMNIITVKYDEMAYMLMWVPDHPVLTQQLMDPEDLLTNAMAGSARNLSGQVVEDNFIELQGHKGIEYKITFMSGRALMISRVLILDQDLVQIMTNGLTRDVLNKENNRFFNSFKIKK